MLLLPLEKLGTLSVCPLSCRRYVSGGSFPRPPGSRHPHPHAQTSAGPLNQRPGVRRVPLPSRSSPGTLRAAGVALASGAQRRCSLAAGWSQPRPARRPCPAHPTEPREQVRALVRPADRKQHPILLLLLCRPTQGQSFLRPLISGRSSYRFGAKLPKGSICRGANTDWQEGSLPRKVAIQKYHLLAHRPGPFI